DNTPVVAGSALQALEGGDDSSVLALIKVLDELPEPQRLQDAPLSMPISSKAQITGRGTVVIGTVERGTLKKGETVEIKGLDDEVKTVASDIQVFKQSVKQVTAGEHCGILCRGLKADMVERGMWLGKPGTIITSNLLKVELYMLTEAEGGRKQGVRTGFTERIFASTWDQPGRICIPGELLMPGDHTTAHLLFIHQMPVRKNMTFTLREGRERTIARGIVSDIYKPMFVDTFQKLDFEKLLKDAKLLSA
ncbi:mitochondrial elongation factor Tu2 precursor, partial [Aphelenchoides avenae]